MKKVLLIAVLLSSFAFAKGSSGGFGIGLVSKHTFDSAGVSIKYSDIQFQIYGSSMEVAYLWGNFDFWKYFSLYAGVGADLGWGSNLNVGAIVPVGLAVHLGPVDIFGEYVPGYQVIQTSGFDTTTNVGFRINF